MSGPLSAAAAQHFHQRNASASASVNTSPVTGTPQGSDRDDDGDGGDGCGSGDDDDDDDAMTLDPSMLPKELSTHWTGFFYEIFVFKNTVMPLLVPQIIVAFFLGVFAQVLKMQVCSKDVVAAAECETTFDITGHQVVSVSLGFLLVFRTDWAYDRYYEGKQAMGQLYSGLRNINVCFVNYLRENKSGERAAAQAAAAGGDDHYSPPFPPLKNKTKENKHTHTRAHTVKPAALT